MAKLSQSCLQITYADEVICDNSNESVWETFKDKWLSKSERFYLIKYGIGTQNWGKLTSKGNSGASSGDTAKVGDSPMYSIFGTKLKFRLCNILESIGLFVPNTMMNNLRYIKTLPESTDVLVKQSCQARVECSPENLEFEYQSMMNEDFASEITCEFAVGKSLIFEHVTMFARIPWAKAVTIKIINVNVSRKSMRAIVLFFKDDNVDSEVFPYPKISKVKIPIEGLLNQIYSRDLKQSRLYEETLRYFSNKMSFDNKITVAEFFEDTFCVCI